MSQEQRRWWIDALAIAVCLIAAAAVGVVIGVWLP